MKKYIASMICFVLIVAKMNIETYALENKFSSTTTGSVIGVINGKVIKINSIKENLYQLSVENGESTINFDENISNEMELLDINKNTVLLRDSKKTNEYYYILDLNGNKLQKLTDIHNLFEKNLTGESKKNKDKLNKVTYYEHFIDSCGVIWFRYAATSVGESSFYVANGIANSNGKYYNTDINGTVVNFTKGNNGTFYAVNVDEIPLGDTIKTTASLLKITENFVVRLYDMKYTEKLKNSRIEADKDDFIYVFQADFKDDKNIYSVNSYKLESQLSFVSGFSDINEKVLDISKDINGDVYILLQGKIDMIDGNKLVDFKVVDGEKNVFQIYNNENYFVGKRYHDEISDKNIFSYTYAVSKDANGLKENSEKLLMDKDRSHDAESQTVSGNGVEKGKEVQYTYYLLIVLGMTVTILVIFFAIRRNSF